MHERLASWRLRLRRGPVHALWLGPDGLWDYASPAPSHHASFDAWCQAHAGSACTLWLSGNWLHELMADARLPLHGDAELLAYGRRLLQHYHGEAALHWPLAAWQAGGQRGVSALHGLPLAALQASARQAGVALRALRPWWSQALAAALQQSARLASSDSARLLVVEGTLVSQLDLQQGRLHALQQRRLAAATPQALQAVVDDEPMAFCWALGHGLQAAPGRAGGLSGVSALGALSGPAPDARWWQAAGQAQPAFL